MNSQQTQWSMIMVTVLAGTVGFLAFLMLMVMGDYGFSAAAFVAIVIFAVVFLVLLLGFHSKPEKPAASTTARAPVQSSAKPAEPAPAPAPAASGSGEASAVAPSAALPGQEELAAKKGEWKYENGDAASDAAAVPASEDQAAESVEESEPQIYAAPPDDGADDLKVIKGVGPGLEKTLNELGIYKYAQVAAWGPAEIAWVDARLKFKGRIERDGWVAQAKELGGG